MNKTIPELVDPKLYLLEERTKTIAFLLGVMAVLLCAGLWRGDAAHYHVVTMLDTLNIYWWTALLVVYATIKMYTKTKPITDTVAACFGLWLWIYLFLTFVVLDKEPASPLESMLLLPILLEAWELLLNVVSVHLTYKWEKYANK